MEFVKSAYRRITALFTGTQLETDMDQEMRLHLDLLAKEYEQSGMSPADAQLAARRRFGNLDRVKERGRDVRGAGLLDDLRRDFLYALHMLRRNPGFTAVVVISLGLGIGANTAMYSAIDALFFREIPVENPAELVVFGWRSGPSRNPFTAPGMLQMSSSGMGEARISTTMGATFAPDLARKFTSEGSSLASVATFAGLDLDATIDGQGDEITAQLVSGNFYRTLGIAAEAGRLLTPADDSPSADVAVVISHDYWRRRFGLDPSAIGKQVVLNGILPATIVGVTPPNFHMGQGRVLDLSIPVAFTQLAPALFTPENWRLGVVGRMKTGIGVEQVRSNLAGLFQGFVLDAAPNTAAVDMPKLEVFSAAQGFTRELVGEYMRRTLRKYQLLLVLFGAVIVVFLIVGLNVANLLIARAATRRYEIGVRLAMGASRNRLIRQLLTESVTLALVGGALGILLAYLGKDILRLVLQQEGHAALDFKIDPRVLGFSAIVSLVTGVFFGISPAFRATRMDVSSAVKQGSRAIAGSRANVGRALLVIQVAMSVILLVGAGLLLRTVGNLPSNDLGFNAENMLSFRVNADAFYGDRARYENVIAAVKAVPGVLAVTSSSSGFLRSDDGWFNGGIQFFPPGEGREPVKVGQVRMLAIRPNFFETLGIPVIRGRGFDSGDVSDPLHVAVVTESLARRFTSEPIGWRLQIGKVMKGTGRETWKMEDFEIVGVVKNVGLSEIGRNIDGTVFFPESQHDSLPTNFDIRMTGNPMTAIASIREELRGIHPDLRASQVSPETELARQKLAPTRYIAIAWAAFGGIALLLTSIGLYGLLSHAVSRRTNEIGIRMALGAPRFHVVRVIMANIFVLVFIGLLVGFGLSVVMNVLMQAFVYGVKFNDAPTFLAAAVIMLLVTAFASYLPARRATRIDPTVALRHE